MERYESWLDRAKSSLELAQVKIAALCLDWVENKIKETEENKKPG
jgi:hypothetical protein